MSKIDPDALALPLAIASAETSPPAVNGAPVWSNIHAPDAARASAAAAFAFAPAGRACVLCAYFGNPTALLGFLILALVVAVAIAAPFLFPEDPLAMVGRLLLWPGQDADFPLGTDALGRDVAAGLAHGAQVSLLIAAAATLVSLTAGTLIGALAGYFGGWADDALVKLIELFQTIPGFILLIVLVAIAQPSVPAITLSIGLVSWPQVARLVRAEFRALRALPTGCRFHPRCPKATNLCTRVDPALTDAGAGKAVACHHPDLPVRH